jgi:hypothetical protein
MYQDVQMYIQTSKYEGIDRRQSPRTKIKVVSKLLVNDVESWVPVVNLSHGGCKAIITFQINPQGVIAMQFLKKENNTFKEMTPVHGRVITTHKREKTFHTHIDFKGALFVEHGIDGLINEWRGKVK